MAKKDKSSSSKKTPAKQQKDKETKSPVVKSNIDSGNLLPMIVLLLLPFALYAASLSFEYVLDDKIVITDNAFVKKGLSGISDIFKTDSFEGYFGEQKNILAGGRYRPLSIVTFAIEYEFFGLNPLIGHLVNILLYTLSGLLLYQILLLLIPPLKGNRWFLSLPFIASLLFVLHPVHTEVVANIKGRDEILALMFSFLALYFSIRSVKSRQLLNLIGASLALLLGMLAKENALTWLAIIPLSMYFFTKSTWGQIGKVLAVLMATVIIYFMIRYNAIGHFISSGEESTDIMNNPFYGLDAGEKAATILYTLGMYVKLLLYPHPLTHDYYPYQIPIISFTDWRALLALLIHLGLGVYALLGLKRKSIVSYGILFYFITLSIVSNVFINVGTTMNERFIYMPSVGLCIILAYFIARWLPAKLNEKPNEINVISVGLLGILILGYGTKVLDRVPDWKNPLTLNSAAVTYSPNSARANCFMGVAIFEDYKKVTDRNQKLALLNDVTYYIDRSLEIYPAYGSALTMKSGVLAEHYKMDYDIDKLLAGFTTVLRYKERTAFTDEYIQYLIDQSRSPEKLIEFLYTVGHKINLEGRGNNRIALHYLNFAYQINPANSKVIQAIVQCHQNLGNTAKAQEFARLLQ